MFFKNAIIKQTPIPIVAQGLDAYMMRSKAINNNLSNITTPGYQRIEVSFEEQLQRALDEKNIPGKRTDANHMHLGKSTLHRVQAEAFRAEDATNPGEINNVDVDLEMSKLAENQIQFQFAVKFIKEQMDGISSAIRMAKG
jgi:flagellar basal-body rod protein FlgB